MREYWNYVDSQYFDCLRTIREQGYQKTTRSGEVISHFGLSMRFNLKYGFPVLTTKKMFVKGFIHELLWFLKGDTNIKYLIDNGVNFWTPDAYRFYNELVDKHLSVTKLNETDTNLRMSLDEFVDKVNAQDSIKLARGKNGNGNLIQIQYTYGDLGPVYGKQWRHWGNNDFDQIRMIIETLKKNPYDRRLILTGYNPEVLKDVALPPCHTIYMFNARPLTYNERIEWCQEHIHPEWLAPTEETMDEHGCPKYALSLWFMCRSQDMALGTPANIMSASLLLSMVAQCVNMVPDEVIWNGCDCHIYLNQMEGISEQLSRNPQKYGLPTLVLNPEVKDIDMFTFDDIKIEGYESYPAIKMPLSVG
jgi:thymidylate synthase